jgi:hypothetical protein
MAKAINELFNELEEIAQEERDWLICTPKEARVILENDRRKNEKIDMLEGAIEGWRRADDEQRETIEILGSWITAEVNEVKKRADRLMPPFD